MASVLHQVTGLTAGTASQPAERPSRDRLWIATPGNAESNLVDQLRRENRELKRANDILQRVASYLVQAEQSRRAG